jgi:hypothetical protein
MVNHEREPESKLDRGFRRLMTTVGVIMMLAPAAELTVQLVYQERPHILLLAGLFLVGLLTMSHALSRESVSFPGWTPPDLRLRRQHVRGEPFWPPDPED